MGLDPLSLLTDDADVATWNNQGLPSDRMSTENATILCNTERWPLIVDAQLQGIKWLKNKYRDNLKAIRLGQKRCPAVTTPQGRGAPGGRWPRWEMRLRGFVLVKRWVVFKCKYWPAGGVLNAGGSKNPCPRREGEGSVTRGTYPQRTGYRGAQRGPHQCLRNTRMTPLQMCVHFGGPPGI